MNYISPVHNPHYSPVIEKSIPDTPVRTAEVLQPYRSLYEYIVKDFTQNHTYRIKGLTLTKYSQLLGIHSYKISACVNAMSGSSFTDYVNKYRLADAKQMLADTSINHYTAEAIGLDAGFSSKATFFPAFKKSEKTTPAEYRKKIQLKKNN